MSFVDDEGGSLKGRPVGLGAGRHTPSFGLRVCTLNHRASGSF